MNEVQNRLGGVQLLGRWFVTLRVVHVLRIAGGGVVFAAMAGCSSMVLTQPVPINSEPAGALATEAGGQSCQTPCVLELERTRDHVITISKPGFQPQSIIVSRQYRAAEVWMGALSAGLQTNGQPVNATRMLNRSMQSVQTQERTGQAYELYPAAVSVVLVAQ